MFLFEKKFLTTWDDVDINNHVRHEVYIQNSATLRLIWFHQNGIDYNYFKENSCGPILLKEYIDYKSEMYMLEEMYIRLFILGMSKDTQRWLLKHIIYNNKEKIAAEIFIEGAFIDTNTRKMITPPERIYNIFKKLKNDNPDLIQEISYLKPSLLHNCRKL